MDAEEKRVITGSEQLTAIANREIAPNFTRSTYEALQELSKTSTGREIITNLQISDFKFTIRHREFGEFKPDYAGEASGFGNQERLPDEMKQMIILGSGGTVFWNEQGQLLSTTDGETNGKPHIEKT